MSNIVQNNTTALVLDSQSFKSIMDFAGMMSTGITTVPKHLQKSPADCAAVIMQAMQWGMNPYSVAQKTHLVNGILGYEAQLVNAVVCNSGLIDGTFKYEYQGEGAVLACRVGAKIRGDHEITFGPWLSVATVQVKNSPLWKTNPAQQLGYLQVKNWARQYCPGAILGVYTEDELQAIERGEPKDVTPDAEKIHHSKPVISEPHFQNALKKYGPAVANGTKSAAAFIEHLQKTNTLTEAQILEIESLAPQAAIDGELAK